MREKEREKFGVLFQESSTQRSSSRTVFAGVVSQQGVYQPTAERLRERVISLACFRAECVYNWDAPRLIQR